MGLTGAGLAGAVTAPWLGATQVVAAAADADADLVGFNAKVYTIDARLPRAEAFAAKGGRFVAVGTTADIKGLIGKNTQQFDARQMTVVPGFTDCHNHAGGDTLLYEVLVGNPFEVYLLAFAYDVERTADLDRDVLVFRRVVDVILAGELHAALRVGLIDADGARW